MRTGSSGGVTVGLAAAGFAAVLCAQSASAHIPSYHEIRGRVTSNTIIEGPYVSALVGESAIMHFELIHPGQWLVPRQWEQFTMITSTFALDIGESSATLPGDNIQYAFIQDTLAPGDAFLLPDRQMAYPFYTLGFRAQDTSGSVFRNSDTWANFGTYPASRFNQTTWTITDSRGGSLTLQMDEFMMVPAPGTALLLPSLLLIHRRRR